MTPRHHEHHGNAEGRREAEAAAKPDIACRRRERALAVHDHDENACHAEENGSPGAPWQPFGEYEDAKRRGDQRRGGECRHHDGDRGLHRREVERDGVEEIGDDDDNGRTAEQGGELVARPARPFQHDPEDDQAETDQHAAPEGEPPPFEAGQPDQKRIRCDDQRTGKRHHKAEGRARHAA